MLGEGVGNSGALGARFIVSLALSFFFSALDAGSGVVSAEVGGVFVELSVTSFELGVVFFKLGVVGFDSNIYIFILALLNFLPNMLILRLP